MSGGQGGGGLSFVKQVEAPPDVSQAPGLLQAREMEGQGLDFPQEPLLCSGTAREGSGQGEADAGHVSTRGSSGRVGLGGGVTGTAHSCALPCSSRAWAESLCV